MTTVRGVIDASRAMLSKELSLCTLSNIHISAQPGFLLRQPISRCGRSSPSASNATVFYGAICVAIVAILLYGLLASSN
jgi:hypothetical protein